jgi:hypothetical protein
MDKTILLIGACGSGKTWVMRQLIDSFADRKRCKIGKVHFTLSNKVAILGSYDGSMYEGSDKLSMAVMSDADLLKSMQKRLNLTIVCEGDRFTNSTFISKFRPLIIKILDTGESGRVLRKSKQTQRQIKSIQTRVSKIAANLNVVNSSDALEAIKKILDEKN